MSKFLFLVLSILTFQLNSGCQKEDEVVVVPPTHEWGAGQALKNGKQWDVTCNTWVSPDYPDQFSLHLNNRNSAGFRRASFHFSHIPFQLGQYFPPQYEYVHGSPKSLAVSFYTALSDGDVLGDKYVLLKDSSIYLTIDKIDANGEVWGIFGGTLIKELIDGIEYDPASPDTLVFEKGEYHCKVDQ